MISLNCSHCSKTSLVNLENVISMHRSLEGTAAYVRCHCGAIAMHLIPRPERVKAAWMIDENESSHASAC